MTASCPGKIFLLGEYAILDRRPCVVAAIAPRFRLTAKASDWTDASSITGPFHPQSPAGRLMKWLEESGQPLFPELSFEDTSGGGFGASTAQFALLWSLTAKAGGAEWRNAWKLYRALTSDSPLPPSGADLVAQFQGGLLRITPAKGNGNDAPGVTDLSGNFDGSLFLIFSASGIPGRKIPTHEHLEVLAKSGFPGSKKRLMDELESLTMQGMEALATLRTSAQAREILAEALNGYAEKLQAEGLESPFTSEDRAWFRKQPGVLAVKGCGALQADALVVLLDSDANTGSWKRADLVEAARLRGLTLVSDGLKPEMGLLLESNR